MLLGAGGLFGTQYFPVWKTYAGLNTVGALKLPITLHTSSITKRRYSTF